MREVLRQRRAHCIEGAFVAACALWVHGEPPLLGTSTATRTTPTCVALFRRGGHWGAISKTNGAVLRYRDPVYRTLRELAMSYFHEYCEPASADKRCAARPPFDLRRVDPDLWVTSTDRPAAPGARPPWEGLRHYPLLSRAQLRLLTRRDTFEQRVAKVVEFPTPRVG